MTYYETIDNSERLWRWMKDNPKRDKREWPEYESSGLNRMPGNCFLCEYNNKNKIECRDCIIGRQCTVWICSNYSFKSRLAIWKKLEKEKRRLEK